MIRRRNITRANRPETAEEAFDLFAQLSKKLPSQKDPELSLAQVRTCYLDSVRSLTHQYECEAAVLRRELISRRLALDTLSTKLRKLHGRMPFLERIRWAFTWKPLLHHLPEDANV